MIALALALAAVPVVGAAGRISDETSCRDLRAQGTEPQLGENCFAGSIQRRGVVAGLLVLAAGAAVLASLLGVVATIRGSRGILFALITLMALGLFIGAYGAARF